MLRAEGAFDTSTQLLAVVSEVQQLHEAQLLDLGVFLLEKKKAGQRQTDAERMTELEFNTLHIIAR